MAIPKIHRPLSGTEREKLRKEIDRRKRKRLGIVKDKKPNRGNLTAIDLVFEAVDNDGFDALQLTIKYGLVE